MEKPIHITVIINSEEYCESSFYFKNATVGQLSMLNHELGILKQEILERIRDSPKDYEVKDFE